MGNYIYNSSTIGAMGSASYSPSLVDSAQKIYFNAVTGKEKGFAVGGGLGFQATQFGPSVNKLSNTIGPSAQASIYFNPHDEGFFAKGSVDGAMGDHKGIYHSGIGLDATSLNYDVEAGFGAVSQYSTCGRVDDNLIKFSLGAAVKNNFINSNYSNKSLFAKVNWETGNSVISVRGGGMSVANGSVQPFGELSYAIGLNKSDRKRAR